ncbi:MAG: GNAT family N-acetyltransferase [Alphaproteobacteria bacterium]|nr:GNAT family N-acetyltransferase [Alphaproteobacteria bacterium]
MNNTLKKYEVNEQMVWQGNLSKIDGVCQEKPVHFYIRPLSVDNAQQMGDLSEAIYNSLKEGEECFIHKHSKEYYYDVFQNPNIHYIGVFVGEHLVGMSYLKVCNNEQELQDELPNSSFNFFADAKKETSVASFGADSVLPSYRGNSLNAMMINYRMELASRLGCTDCTSIVDRNNRWNMTPYFANRFNLFSTAVDPSDGGKISLLHKPMAKETVLSNIKTRITLPYNRFELIDKLIKKGFIGVEFDKKEAKVTFAHSNYYVPNTRKSFNIFDRYNYNKAFVI